MPPLRSFRGTAASAVEVLQEEKIEKSIKSQKRVRQKKIHRGRKAKQITALKKQTDIRLFIDLRRVFGLIQGQRTMISFKNGSIGMPHLHQATIFQNVFVL